MVAPPLGSVSESLPAPSSPNGIKVALAGEVAFCEAKILMCERFGVFAGKLTLCGGVSVLRGDRRFAGGLELDVGNTPQQCT